MKGMNLDANSLKMPGKGGAAAAPSGPLLPSQGVFRQKAWLPWWLVPVAIALAALAVLLYMLLPKNVVVPDLVGAKSTFDAEKKLTEAGLKLGRRAEGEGRPEGPGRQRHQPDARRRREGREGRAGDRADRGRRRQDQRPEGRRHEPRRRRGRAARQEAHGRQDGADAARSRGHDREPDPGRERGRQGGRAGRHLLRRPQRQGQGQGPEGRRRRRRRRGAAGGGGGGGGGGEKDIVIPAIDGAKVDDFAAKLAEDELVPQTKRVFDASPVGTLFATEPPGGTKAAAGDKVTLLVSAGFPQLAFDDDKNIQLVNGATGKQLDPIAKSPAREKDPTFSPDGTRVAYMAERPGDAQGHGRSRTRRRSRSRPTATSTRDLAWAPTADVNLIAMARVKGDDTRPVHRPADRGRADAALHRRAEVPGRPARSTGRRTASRSSASASRSAGEFGMFRWRSKKAFSPDPRDWGKGKLETDISKANEGVLDAAFSPDGTQLALVSNQGGGPFQLYLAKKNDFLLTSAKETRRPGVQGRVAQRRPGARGRAGRRGLPARTSARSRACRSRTRRTQTEVGVQGRQPGLPAADARAVAMLCPSCRRQLDRGGGFCLNCGTPRPGHVAPLELVLGDRTRVPVVAEMTIGRSPGSTVVLEDPTVSRVHARISGNGGDTATIEDAGSSHGTWVDGARIDRPFELRDGIKLRLGDQEMLVERRRENTEAGRTIVVRPGASLIVPAMGRPDVTSQATQFGMRPRIRSGYALKRLEADEGRKRWVLKDLNTNTYLRLSDNDAKIFKQLDGTRSLVDLIGFAEQQFGPAGPARLARLLADLGERGLPGRRRARDAPRAGRAAARGPAQAAVPPAREDVRRHRPVLRAALPARGLGAVHQAGPDRAGRAGRDRARRVRLPDRRPLRDAVRRRVEDRPRRARVPRRPLHRGGDPRDRARARDGLLRPQGREGRREAAVHLPVRVRRYL